MKETNYNFQIKVPGTSWDECEAKTVAFPVRKDAMTFAYNLSYMVNREIRVTTGDYKVESGTYIKM